MRQEVEGRILWLRCSSCSAEFPVFVFAGENDWTTAGLRTKTDIDDKTVYIYQHTDTPPAGAEVELIKVDHIKSKPGESFQEYRDRAADFEDRYIYRCLACRSGHAEDVEGIEPAELGSRGYKLVGGASAGRHW